MPLASKAPRQEEHSRRAVASAANVGDRHALSCVVAESVEFAANTALADRQNYNTILCYTRQKI